MMEPTICVDLTERELHVLTCAMAGNYPPALNDARIPTLRKLTKAYNTLTFLKKAERPDSAYDGNTLSSKPIW